MLNYIDFSKMPKEDIIIALSVLGFTLSMAIKGYAQEKRLEEISKNNYECNVIVISNGEINRQDNIVKKGRTSSDYDIVYQDEHSLVIFVYEENIAERKLYTDYIESMIAIDDEKNVYFSEEDISKDGFTAYVSELSNNNEENIQRKRG